MEFLDEISHIARHLFDLGVVEALYVSEVLDIRLGGEVDRDTQSTETSAMTDTANVVLSVGWKVVVDDQ